MIRYSILPILIVSSALFESCSQRTTPYQYPEAVQADTIVNQPREICLSMPDDSQDSTYIGLQSSSVYDLYRSNDFQPHWVDHGQLVPKAAELISVAESARLYGLFPQEYHVAEIRSILNNSDCASLFRMDALLTDAYFTMSSHIRNGRLMPVTTDSTLFTGWLKTDSSIRSRLEMQEPKHTGYKHLRSALISIYDTLTEHDRRLLLDGLTSDTIPSQKLIKTIEINLERWRWEKEPPVPDYVMVNIPAYEVRVFKDDSLILKSKAIVGKRSTRTPLLSSEIECFMVYPYWHVPRSIATKEYLPSIQKDISFITRNNFEVLDRKGNILGYDTLDWHKFTPNNFPVTLRQREGQDNSLGIVKFSFNNPYAVYLHDTNAKRLFQRENRALSHGCVRMEKAVEFAHYLATTYTKYTPKMIDEFITHKKKHTVELERPLPIHIRYFTCESDGVTLRRFEDIYLMDNALYDEFYNITPTARQ